jgi:multiple sugar transport system substrate-binding protein
MTGMRTTRRGTVRRALAAGGAAVGATLGVAGCSPVGRGGGEGAARTAGPATIDVAYNFTPFEMPYLERHTQAFMRANPQITVNTTNTQGDEFYTKLTAMLAGGTPPHMTHMTSRWAGQFIRGQKALTDLTPFTRQDRVDVRDFWPLLSEGFADEEKRPMVLPYDITVQLLYYNAGLLRAAGAPLPTERWTLDDMLAAAQKAARKSGDQLEVAGYDGLPNGGQFEYAVERFGGRLLDDRLTHCELNSAGSVAGIQFWTDLRHRHNVAPVNAQQIGGLNLLQSFTQGRLALAGSGTTFASQVKAADPAFEWDVVAVPRGPAGDPLRAGGGGYGLVKGARDQDSAWRYLTFMVSAGVLMDMVGQPRRSVPGRASVAKAVAAESGTAPGNWKVIVPVTEKARHITFGLTPKGGDVLQEVTPALNKVYAGGTNVKSELDALAQRIDAILGAR